MAVEVECARRLFTADEFERMAEAGIFGEEERVEVYRSPESDAYRESRRVPHRDGAISALSFPDVVSSVADIFA